MTSVHLDMMDSENQRNASSETAYASFLAVRRRGAFGRSKEATQDSCNDKNASTEAPIQEMITKTSTSDIRPFDEHASMTDLFDLEDSDDDSLEPGQPGVDIELPFEDMSYDDENDIEGQAADDATRENKPASVESPLTAAENEAFSEVTEGLAQETTTDENNPHVEAKMMTIESVMQSTDVLFAGIEDKSTVTVKDVLRALQEEYQLKETLPKDMKLAVRERLVELMQLERQQQERAGKSASENETDAEDSDLDTIGDSDKDESHEESNKRGQDRKKRAAPKRQSQKAKASAMRIHAEQLRKRRMEELRVRNEELQAIEDEKDKERSEQIAAKFETNTDEQRLQRLEQRLGLLQKLDQKRVNIIERQKLVNDEMPLSDDQQGKSDPNSSDDDEDMELELVGVTKLLRPCKKPSAVALLEMMARPQNIVARQILEQHQSTLHKSAAHRSPGKSMAARATLKNKLRSKKTRMGNAWLARELGYKTEEDHLKDCLIVEERKRQRALKLEEERIKLNELRRQRLLVDGSDDEEYVEEKTPVDEDLTSLRQEAHDKEEEDEEIVLAKEIEREQLANDDGEETKNENDPMQIFDDDIDDDSVESDDDISQKGEEAIVPLSHAETKAPAMPSTDNPQEMETEIEVTESTHGSKCSPIFSRTVSETPSDSDNPFSAAEHASAESGGSSKSVEPIKKVSRDGPRNSAWKAMLEKEVEQMKQMKKRKGAGLVEDEADEEEEEEVAGLEDFGFTVKKKKSDDDDDERADDEIDEDDLEHVVDDLSDNEGDEDAGERARILMMQKEEKERHKEMMRLMRHGYDGRRGGIAVGGAGARGIHRFDQLVAADNREDAKRLGLLNDDEIDSDDEEEKKGDADDEEDEAALLDKMLKDRFLHRSSVLDDLEENFSEDEENLADENDDKGIGDDVDEEEREQERLAKRFAKRARMQRLLDVHGHDEEFSQSRLMEEDSTLKEELSQMKCGLARKRNLSSVAAPELSSSSIVNKIQKTSGLFGQNTLGKSSLASALLNSRRVNTKTRTSFVRLGSASGGNEVAASFQKSIAFKSVVFHSSDLRSNASSSHELSKGTGTIGLRNGTKSVQSASFWSKAIAGGSRRV